MRSGMFHWLAGAAVAIAASALPANALKKYDPGASDTEIKIGQTVPFSGPASAYAGIGKTQAAYFKMINEQGGINGRKLNLIQYDDAYSPPKAVEQVRKLVEGDEVLFTFQIIGTPSNAAVQKYLNAKKVPQLLAATGASKFTDPKNFPWTMGFNPNYQSEGRIYGQYILKNHPTARIGILYQNDDLGRDYVTGLKEALGSKAATMIVAGFLELTDPTIDSQIVRLKAAGADLLYDASTPKFAAQAIKKAADLGWKPVHILDINASPISATLKPAGLENSKDMISTAYGKDPGDPQWKDDAGMKAYFAFMDKYYPEGDKQNTVDIYADIHCGTAGAYPATMRRRSHARKHHEAGDQPEERHRQPVAARHGHQHLADRLPHQQADADDEVQRRTLGAVRPDHRGCRTGRLAPAPI